MTLCIICAVAVGLIAIRQARRVAHWMLVARVLARDVIVERAKRKALAMALGDLEAGLKRGDSLLCAQAMRAALLVARDDTDATLIKLGFTLPERIS
jgi:hypothetical protein